MSSQPFEKQNLAAFANFLRGKHDMYCGAARVESRPYFLCVDPCDICQLRCPTCPTGIENESKRQKSALPISYRSDRTRMTPELFNALMDELGPYLFHIMFYNYGEPLLNAHLAEFIRKAKSYDISTEVHSNLSLKLTDERIDELIDSGLDRLVASIDGFTQEAYQIHRVGGNVELVKSNLQRLAEAKQRLGSDTVIMYKFLVFRHNEHEIGAARDFAKSIGIEFAQDDALISDPSWLPSHRKNEQPYYSEEEMARMYEQWDAAGAGDYWQDHERHQFWNPIPRIDESKLTSSCGWHYGYSVVTAGGHVAPCCAVAKDRDDFGKVQPESVRFGDVWNNDQYAKSRLALLGKTDSDLDDVDTVCLRCYFPAFLKNLYTFYDLKVFAQFYRCCQDEQAQITEAFDILCQDRYGAEALEKLKNGTFEPRMQMMLGAGNEANTQRFVSFFEQHLKASDQQARSTN